MANREDWETPEAGVNEALARELADLGPLMRETSHAANEPPDPTFLQRLKNRLLPENPPRQTGKEDDHEPI